MSSVLKLLGFIVLSLIFGPVLTWAQQCKISDGHTTLKPAQWYMIEDAPFTAETPEDYLWVYMSISGEDHILPAWSVNGQSFEFIIPADYLNPWQDKPIDSFWLTDGEQGCEVPGLTHSALEPNPVGIPTMAMNIVGEYQALAAEMGYPIADIKSVVEDQKLPPENEPVLRVIAGAMGFFGDYVRFSRNADQETKQVLSVMNAYLAAAQNVDHQNARSEVNQALYDWHAEQQLMSNSKQFYPMSSSSWGQVPKLFFDEVTRKPETDFTHPKTPEHLSLQMRKQYRASLITRVDKLRGHTDLSPYRDVAGTLLGLGSTLASHDGGVGKGVGFAYARASEWLFMQAFTDKLVEALYPAEFVSIEAVGGPYDLYTEDKPKNGKITAINVVTKSKGGISMMQMFADVVNQFFPYNKALGKISGKAGKLAKSVASPALKKLPPGTMNMIRIKMLHPKVVSVQRAIEPAREMVEHVAKQLLAQHIGDKQSAGDFKSTDIKPITFSPINILQRGYHQTNVEPSNVISFETGEKSIKYAALSKGRAVIRFQTYPNKWGNENISGEKVVRVNADDLIIDPKIVSVVPGDMTGFDVLHRVKGDKTPNKSDLIVSIGEPGFSVNGISGPYMRGTSSDRWTRWVVYVETPESTARYPTPFEVSLRSNPAINDQGRIEGGHIAPDRVCIDEGETEHFFYADHLGRPIPGVEWQADGPGKITQAGIYTAPKTVSAGTEVEIIAKSRQTGSVVSRKSYTLGCACFWQASMNGKTYSGTKISAANMSFGPVSNVNIMTLDSTPLMFALTGEGHILAPKYLSAAFQDKDISYISGLPVNVNIGKMLGNDSCQTAETQIRSWSVENRRWLSGHVAGELTTDAALASGCVTSLTPFDFRFMIDLGENTEITERVMDDLRSGKISTNSPEVDALLRAVTRQPGSIAACLSD